MSSIDIVIPCAGRAADLKRLLTSLHGHCPRALQTCVATITVTDDRPSKDLEKTLAIDFPRVDYVHGPARGPASNRNFGAGQGAAKWILFLDDDCYLAGDLLQAYLVQVEQTPECDVLEGAIHPVGSRPNGNHHAPLNLQGGCLWSCNILIRRQTFESVGGFDERFPFACMEDVDLANRIRAVHAVIAYASEALVFHPWRSISEREVYRQVVSHAIYAEKHPEFVHRWTMKHLVRAMRGRVRLYANGGFSSIPLAKYRTVVFDFFAPVLVYILMHNGLLRKWLNRRHCN